jgi:hypothetical protein|uniref:Uncharacterized protein n=2 Tax=unclassified Caudoviricetes TaxID=2788787 RepID=A0A8S5PPM1_9CAUD|nr:MAG TPA: hypothetical protein [Siphoviridae sp. ctdoa10]DAE08802.1 MAG TPA: hypothetical protein [Siphoviridae sp. ctAiL5]
MSEEKQGQCLPSQVTINIGASGVKVNDGAPQVDTSKLATKEEVAGKATKADVDAVNVKVEQVRTVAGKAAADAVEAKVVAGKALTKEGADAAYATKAQVAAMGDSIRGTRSAAEQTKADGEATKAIAQHAEELTQTLAKNLAVFPRVLRLDKGQAVPADTPLGTVIVRSERAISHADDLFPPIGEWPKISAADTGDGVRLDFQHPALVPALDQLKPSDGKWLLTMRYSFPGGNFGEEETQVNLWTARRYQEEGHPAQVDQGSKIADLTVRKGEHLELSLEIEPRKVDEKIGDVWGVWMDAPIPVLYVHDLVIRKVV